LFYEIFIWGLAMRIKRKYLKILIERFLLKEFEYGYGDSIPDKKDTSTYEDMSFENSHDGIQAGLAAASIFDLTPITDFVSCFLYMMVGDYKSAATVVVFSGMGIGAGAGAAKFIKLSKKSEEGVKVSLKKSGISDSKAQEMVNELNDHIKENITYPSKPIPTREAKDISDEIFRKFDRKNPLKSSEKVTSPGQTGRISVRTRQGRMTTLADEYDAMVRMNKILPNNSVKPLRIVNDSYIDMERMSGATLEQIELALKGKRLEKGLDEIDIDDIGSIKKQLEDIRQVLFSHKDFQHGDLHSGNIFIDEDGIVKLFDPAGLRPGEMAKRVDDAMLAKHISFLRSLIDNPQKPGNNIGSLLQKESLYRFIFPTKY